MSIPLVDLRKQYAPLKDEIISGIEKVLDSMLLFPGENVQALEEEFAQFCGTEFGIGVSDGTTALHIILRAMGIGSGDEVITVSHTFIATAEAIVLAGATPVFVDIEPDTCLMNVAQVEKKITQRTKAILPVHLYGQTVDMDPLIEIASRHNLRVIEDACQAHGAEYHGRKSGSLGYAAAFSFYHDMNLGAYGEGGFITTNDPGLARKIKMIRNHGSERLYYHDLLGVNSWLDEIQAVILRTKLPHLSEWNEKRHSHAALYNELLKDTPVVIPVERTNNKSVYHCYVIKSQYRDELQAWLNDHDIFTGIHYPVPIHFQGAFHFVNNKFGDLPVTNRITKEILSLPMYAELTDEEIEKVTSSIKEFYQSNVKPGKNKEIAFNHSGI